ncbi:hypothetical protein WJX72_002090 [[Myrmecia] bisecta]|uniref:Uncharacterized protein n=1 Tax=[Myrmecia] bisecta TaxID=41462 RepID=A0AAW1Q6N9_9CHLO
MYRRALQSCVKANAQDPSACNRLDTRLAECYAEDVCPLETAAFQTCYHKVGTLAEKDPGDLKGRLKERGIDCEAEATAMKRCLRDYKLYPFALDAAKKASK